MKSHTRTPSQRVGLTPELIENVVLHVCAETAEKERQSFLVKACLISKEWSRIAQPLLFRDIDIALHPDHPDLAPVAMQIKSKPALGAYVHVLDCDFALQVATFDETVEVSKQEQTDMLKRVESYVADFLDLCVNLRQLYIRDTFPLEQRYTTLSRPAFSKTLRQLTLGQSNNDTLPMIMSWLPQLQVLELDEHFAVGHTNQLEHYTCETPLRLLAFTHSKAAPVFWVSDMLKWLRPGIAASLQHIELNGVYGNAANSILTSHLPLLRFIGLLDIYNNSHMPFEFHKYPNTAETLWLRLDGDAQAFTDVHFWQEADFARLHTYVENSQISDITAVVKRDRVDGKEETQTYAKVFGTMCSHFPLLDFVLRWGEDVVGAQIRPLVRQAGLSGRGTDWEHIETLDELEGVPQPNQGLAGRVSPPESGASSCQ